MNVIPVIFRRDCFHSTRITPAPSVAVSKPEFTALDDAPIALVVNAPKFPKKLPVGPGRAWFGPARIVPAPPFNAPEVALMVVVIGVPAFVKTV